MLYSIGALALDTRPFNVDKIERYASADFATKPLIGGLPGREFMGEGEDKITLSGQLLPTKIGGLTEIEALHGFRRSGTRLPVMRGDGKSFGWRVIESVRESHGDLGRDGIGFTVDYTVELALVDAPSGSDGGGIISSLLSLFGALR